MKLVNQVKVSVESKRGCGFRKPGGLYLVSDGLGAPCGLLPVPLDVCRACGCGVKPSRGWTWVEPAGLLGSKLHEHGEPWCPLSRPDGLGARAGLLWIGEAFYPTTLDFAREAVRQGISRRISAVPRGFEVGQWVLLAHRKACPVRTPDEIIYGRGPDAPEPERGPGVFHVFRPQRIEYVVRGNETNAEIIALEKRGITPVRVEHALEQLEIGNGEVEQ